MRRRPGRTVRRPNLELLALEGRMLLTTFTVTSAADDDSPGTLRDVIQAADADAGPAPTVIAFDIPGTGVQTITPTSPLPAIIHPMFINGYSQPGSSPNDSASGDDAVILIEINGAMAGANASGLSVGTGVTIQGLSIDGFSDNGINIDGAMSATPVVIAGCNLGLTPAGVASANAGDGVDVIESQGVTIGGTAPANRNVISGNTNAGVQIGDTSDALVAGNFVGIGPLGTAIGNGGDGVEVDQGSPGIEIGTATPGGGNVISGNVDSGVAFIGAQGGVVQGNLIGLGPDGETAVGNVTDGVALFQATTGVTVGGAMASERNILSGNGSLAKKTQGVAIIGKGTSQNSVIGNYIGTDITGEKAVPNAADGVIIFGGASGNTIGTNAAGTGNVISGNEGSGILISDAGTDSNSVLGNLIGSDAARKVPLGNSDYGVDIANGASGNSIGYSASTVGSTTISNTILFSGFGYAGVGIYGSGTDGNIVSLNQISANAGGVAIFGGASNNLVGGAPFGNTITNNAGPGVAISNAGTSGNVFYGDMIEADEQQGVNIFGAATGNLIGAPGEPPNLISGNAGPGVSIANSGTSGNIVWSNEIGVASNLVFESGNQGPGVLIQQGASGNQIGGLAASEGNQILNNQGPGVAILAGTENSILTNTIHDNTGLPIDLGANSPSDKTSTDATGSPHSGADDLLNHPILSYATQNGTGVTIGGTLNAVASTTYIIQFFADANATSDHPNGSTFLGLAVVTTDTGGNANFSATFPSTAGAVDVSATATTTTNGTYLDTSEYSPDVVVGKAQKGISDDYDGDGKADLANYNPSTGVWTILRSTAGPETVQLGEPGVDIPVPGDYDCDGKTDLAVYRPTTGQWIIERSTAGPEVVTFGAPGDIPVPGDYFGDGKTDLALYRPSTGQWLIDEPGVAGKVVTFGVPNVDEPVPADYDGDGKTDLALYNPSIGQWLILRSTAGGEVVNFGEPNVDKPIPADYDGDGKADIAVFRPTTDQWLIIQSTAGSKIVQFGQPGLDVPVPEDYDGDGKADIAVYRASTAQWLILRSTAGPEAVTSGPVNVDVAVPAPFSYRYLGALASVTAEAIAPAIVIDPTGSDGEFVLGSNRPRSKSLS